MFEPIDLYCERTSSAFWVEPVNALTNVLFLVSAWFVWRRAKKWKPFPRVSAVARVDVLVDPVGWQCEPILRSFLIYGVRSLWRCEPVIRFINTLQSREL